MKAMTHLQQLLSSHVSMSITWILYQHLPSFLMTQPTSVGLATHQYQVEASLQSCVNEYYLNSIPAFAIFPDDSTNKCWFGSPSISSGSFTPSGNSWTVFIKQSKWLGMKAFSKLISYQISAFVTTVTNDVFTNLQIPNSQLTSSSWNKYVYQMHEAANVNHSTCTAMCAFEFDNGYESNCHFTVYDSNICYLGSLREETSILPTPVIADLDLKTCKCYEDIIKKWNFTCRHVFQMLCQMIKLKAPCFPIQPQVTKQSRSTFTKDWMLLPLMMKHAHLCVTCTYLPLQSVISSFNMVEFVCWVTLNLLELTMLPVMHLLRILMRVSWG